MAIRSNKAMRMALALMFSASAGALAVAATPAAAQTENEAAYFNAYANSGYNFCDAKIMGSFYGFDPYKGKLEIGAKIVNNIRENIKDVLRGGRQMGTTCDWSDLPYSYDDAVALGNYWGVSTWEAKSKAAYYYTNGESASVEDSLRESSVGQEQAAKDAALSAFFTSSYNYCDAKMVGAYFSESAYEGKIFIGTKIKAGMIENVPWYANRARESGNKCDWGDVPYDYDDAARLARMWNKNIGDTKTAIAALVTMGRSDIVDGGLGR